MFSHIIRFHSEAAKYVRITDNGFLATRGYSTRVGSKSTTYSLLRDVNSKWETHVPSPGVEAHMVTMIALYNLYFHSFLTSDPEERPTL